MVILRILLTYLNPGFVQYRTHTISEEDHASMLSIILGVMWVVWVNATHEKETVEEAALLGLHLSPIELAKS